MDKQHILKEIVRTAAGNDGIPLGRLKFLAETGIKESDWAGRYWVRWNDAIQEAGLTPNKLQAAYEPQYLIRKLAELSSELRRIPVAGDLRMKARSDVTFPSHLVFSRLGSKQERISKLAEFCRVH